MYTHIFTKLSQAKKNGQRYAIKHALLFFITEIEAVLELPHETQKKTLPFSEFIEDPKFIFGVENQSVFNEEVPDINISTEGLIAELFARCDIPNSKHTAKNLRNALFALHSKLSRGISDNERETGEIRLILEDVKNYLSS